MSSLRLSCQTLENCIYIFGQCRVSVPFLAPDPQPLCIRGLYNSANNNKVSANSRAKELASGVGYLNTVLGPVP